MNIETFKRFVKPGQVFKISDAGGDHICGGRLAAIHDDCVEIVDSDDDTLLVPHCFFDGCRVYFGPGFDKNFGKGETLESLYDLVGERLGKNKPALAPDEIERLAANVD